MKVLIVGGGEREHAIARKTVRSPRVEKLYCAPGNAGIAQVAKCVDMGVMDFDAQVAFVKEHGIDLVIVGLDDSLAAGAVDALEAAKIRMFGPRKNAAILEGSKAFSKDLTKKYNISTAGYETFDSSEEALAYIEYVPMLIVPKADSLALGRGVLICNTREEAKDDVKTLMLDKQFGSAGDQVVVEEFMTGREVSVLSFMDGKTIKIMTSAQNHKRARDGDQGLNTSGMGAFSPSPFYTEEVDSFCGNCIYQPAVDAMRVGGREFQGIILFELMLTEQDPKVLEYNARFGDPETQAVLSRVKNDTIDVFEACVNGTLDQMELEFEDNTAVYVVLASAGYPGHYEEGYKMTGFGNFKDKDDYYVFHAGNKFDAEGNIVTNDGRVLGVMAKGITLKEARGNAYKATEWIEFGNKYMRHDTGKAIDEA